MNTHFQNFHTKKREYSIIETNTKFNESEFIVPKYTKGIITILSFQLINQSS